MALLSPDEARAILERPASDPRVDEHGLVSIAMPPAELDAWIGMLNQAHIVVREGDNDPAYRIKFTTHYVGAGVATIEMTGDQIDAGPGEPFPTEG